MVFDESAGPDDPVGPANLREAVVDDGYEPVPAGAGELVLKPLRVAGAGDCQLEDESPDLMAVLAHVSPGVLGLRPGSREARPASR